MYPFGSLLIVILLDCLFVLFAYCLYSLIWRDEQSLRWFSAPLTIIALTPLSTLLYMIVRSKSFCMVMWIYHGLVIFAFAGFIVIAYYYPMPQIEPDTTNALEILYYPMNFIFRVANVLIGLIGIILSLVSLSAVSRIYYKTIIIQLEKSQNINTPSETPQPIPTEINSTAQSLRDHL